MKLPLSHPQLERDRALVVSLLRDKNKPELSKEEREFIASFFEREAAAERI